MRGLHVAQRREDRLRAARMLALPVGEHLLHGRALQVLLRAAQVAGDDRKRPPARITLDVALGDVGEWPDHDVSPVLGLELRRHGLELAAEEHVEEQRLDDVVAVMAERDPGDAVLGGVAIERTAPEPRAQPAHRATLRDHPLHDPIGVLLDHVVRDAECRQVSRQHVRGEIRLLLVEVDRHQLEAHRRAALHRQQHVQQRVRVLAARQADHHAVALADHRVVGDGLADLPAQPRGQTPEVVGNAGNGDILHFGSGLRSASEGFRNGECPHLFLDGHLVSCQLGRRRHIRSHSSRYFDSA